MSHDFWKFMVHEFFEIHGPWIFGIQCPTIFCDFGLFNRLAQAGGGGALLYDISLPKTYRPKLLFHLFCPQMAMRIKFGAQIMN